MDQGDPPAEDTADLAEVTVAIWGERPVDGPMEIDEPVLVQIWGNAPVPERDSLQEETESVWPDLWGPKSALARGAGEDVRRRPSARGRGDGPGRYILPESWVASPQQRSPWRQRLHRP